MCIADEVQTALGRTGINFVLYLVDMYERQGACV